MEQNFSEEIDILLLKASQTKDQIRAKTRRHKAEINEIHQAKEDKETKEKHCLEEISEIERKLEEKVKEAEAFRRGIEDKEKSLVEANDRAKDHEDFILKDLELLKKEVIKGVTRDKLIFYKGIFSSKTKDLRCPVCWKMSTEDNLLMEVCSAGHLECQKCNKFEQNCFSCEATKTPKEWEKGKKLLKEKKIIEEILKEIGGKTVIR